MQNQQQNEEDEKKFLASKSLSPYTLRSELAQEIISRQPGFLENWALLMFLGILLLMLGGTWFIDYPEIINARATLTAENAPKEIVVRQEGRLIKLFVKNNQQVNNNEIIGWIETTADHEEVLDLSAKLDTIIKFLNTDNPEKIANVLNKHFYNLGEIQQSYQQFITDRELFNDYTSNGFYLKKMKILQDDIQSLSSLNNNLLQQKNLTAQDLDLSRQTYDINKTLLDKKVISPQEYRAEKSKYVNKEKSIPEIEASLFTNEMQKREKLKEIQQLSHDMDKEKILFQQQLQSFKSQVNEWIKKFVLKAPSDGRIVFNTALQENRYLRTGTVIGYVNPDTSTYYAEATLSQNNLGKLQTGMQVQLRFDAYPYEEWGFIDGTLEYISKVPTDSGFLAIIKLNKGLLTNDNKVLIYKNGLKAEALVITKDMRLLERFYYSFIKSTSVANK